MSRERGSLTPIPSEAYSLRELMSRVTGATYDIQSALPDFPPPSHHTNWYLLGRELRGSNSTAHASTVWQDEKGNMFIQSMYLAHTTDWIGPVYGEEGAIAAMQIDYSDFKRGRKTLAEKFPAVEKRLESYEKILAEISSKYHVDIGLRVEGEKGLATFYVIAEIRAKHLSGEEKVEALRSNVEALKVSWNEIRRHDSRNRQRS